MINFCNCLICLYLVQLSHCSLDHPKHQAVEEMQANMLQSANLTI